jgi:hypothetical protein
MRTRTSILALLVLAALASDVRAQEEPPAAPPAAPDSAFSTPPLSPGGAFLRSLLIPGWAQAELGAEARGAFYFLAASFSWFMAARTQIRLNEAERTQPPDAGLVESRRQQREDWIALGVFWAFFAGADGWVSVQLWGFGERTGLRPPSLSMQFEPEGPALVIGWRLPVGP